jgi:molybdopterin molybdotransferase
MISFEKARELVIQSVRLQPEEKVRLTEAFNRVIAQDVKAPHHLPPFTNSAMDGFALSSQDTQGNPPFKLCLIGDEPAGAVFQGGVKSGETVRIMTGAPLPQGTNAVIPLEEVREEGETVVISRRVEKGENVRLAGEDVKKGEVVLEKGTYLNSAQIGLLAALGVSELSVYKRPQVGILATGEELKEVDEALTPGTIRNSNTYALVGQVKSAGALPVDLGKVGDNVEKTAEVLKTSLKECEVVLTTGGVSMGRYDLVRESFEKLGAEEVFWKVAQKPAKPLAFYLYEKNKLRRYLLGLPGNPGAVMVAFEEYVRPLIYRLTGRKDYLPRELIACLSHEVRKKQGRLNFLRVKISFKNGECWAESVGRQGSGILKTLVHTEALALIPAEVTYLPAGTKVRIHLVGW